MRSLFSVCFLILSTVFSFAQLKSTMLPRNVSSNLESEIAPYINYNGNFILYAIENPRKGGWELWYSEKDRSGWSRGKEVVPVNKILNLNFTGGYAVNNEATEILFSSKKYGGIGGYDLWSVTRKPDGSWGEPKNLGKPLNTSKNEANPNFSLDGKKIYYMVCDQLTEGNSECCKIYSSEKKGDMWGTPKKLDASWNNCVSTPRISPDEKTMYFSSAKNNAFLDLYVSHYKNGHWSSPVVMTEFNTELDDQFISFSLSSQYVYYAQKDNKWNLYIAEMPEAYRFNQLNLFQGKTEASQTGEGLSSKVVLVNQEDPDHVDLQFSDENGYFNFYLPNGEFVMYFEDKSNNEMFVLDTISFREEKLERIRRIVKMEKLSKGQKYNILWAEDERLLQQQLKYLGNISKAKGYQVLVSYPATLSEIQKIKLKEWSDHFRNVTLTEIEDDQEEVTQSTLIELK